MNKIRERGGGDIYDAMMLKQFCRLEVGIKTFKDNYR